MRVGLNDFQRQWQVVGADVLEATRTVGASGWYVLGERVRGFEQRLAAAWGLPHAVGVASGLDALEIGLRCAGVRPGDRVLTAPLTAFATTLAILRCQGTPVYVDVDERGLIDLQACQRLLARERDRGHPICFFVPVHLYGQALDLEWMTDLGARFSLRIVEDCAQSIGARWRGRPTGTAGLVAATSFYPTKNLGALGDGGAVLTSDEAVATLARALRNYGQQATYEHVHAGLNSRLDELHAAILDRAMLPRLDQWTARRRAIAARYRAGIDRATIAMVPQCPGSESVCHLFPVLLEPDRRAAFAEHLGRQGIGTGWHYPRPVTEQQALRDTGRFEVPGDLARARRFAAGEVSLPIHPFLTDAEVDHVIRACNAWEG